MLLLAPGGALRFGAGALLNALLGDLHVHPNAADQMHTYLLPRLWLTTALASAKIDTFQGSGNLAFASTTVSFCAEPVQQLTVAVAQCVYSIECSSQRDTVCHVATTRLCKTCKPRLNSASWPYPEVASGRIPGFGIRLLTAVGLS